MPVYIHALCVNFLTSMLTFVTYILCPKFQLTLHFYEYSNHILSGVLFRLSGYELEYLAMTHYMY